jgi:hypothetical protein
MPDARGAEQSPAPHLVSGEPACDSCRIVLTRIATLGRRTDSVLLHENTELTVDAQGRFYGTSADRYRVLVFEPTGTLSGIIGGRGAGPAEFASSNPIVRVGTGDSLFVRAGRTIKVFGPRLAWERSFAIPAVGPHAVLSRSTVIWVGASGSDTLSWPFHIVSAGSVLRSFGPALLNRRCSYCFLFAVTASFDRETLWSARPDRYELAQWNRQGSLVQHVVFVESRWFRPWTPMTQQGSGLVATRVMQIRQDRTGLVWIKGVVPLETGRGEMRGQATPYRSWDVVLEAYDPSRRRLVASMRSSGRDLYLFHENLVAVTREDADGFLYHDILRAEVRGDRIRRFANKRGER